MAKRYLGLIVLVMLGLFIAGCDKGSDDSTVTNPNPSVFEPKGSISGVVFDMCLNKPVPGAIVSVAYSGSVHSVTTGEDGAFGFNDVPCNTDRAVAADTYTVVCDLTDVASTFATYGYATTTTVDVYYDDLEDGDNGDLVGNDTTESGSGADTPVDGLNATAIFNVATPSGSISGMIYDVTTVRTGTAATVTLFNNTTGDTIGTTTADATTGYTFSYLVPAQDYKLIVKKAGYAIAGFQEPNTVTSDGACYIVDVTCTVLCETAAGTDYALTGVDVNIAADTTTDLTAPFITQVLNGTTEAYDTDDITAAVSSLTLDFSEVMDTGHDASEAITLVSSFVVTVTSGGDGTTTVTTNTISWTGAWDTAGDSFVLTVTALTSDQLIAVAAVAAAIDAAWPGHTGTMVATVGTVGTYTLTVSETTNNLLDASYNPWLVTNDEAYPTNLNAAGVYYQNNVIFDGQGGAGDDNLSLTLRRP